MGYRVHGQGVFVFSTVYGHMVVGPTADDVEQRDSPPHKSRPLSHDQVGALEAHAHRVVPQLRSQRPIGVHSGLRPAATSRDYIIRAATADTGAPWVTVAGIRSTGSCVSINAKLGRTHCENGTGVTASVGIGDYVQAMVCELLGRSSPVPASSIPVPRLHDVTTLQHRTVAVEGSPPVVRNGVFCDVDAGVDAVVTHGLSQFGMCASQ